MWVHAPCRFMRDWVYMDFDEDVMKQGFGKFNVYHFNMYSWYINIHSYICNYLATYIAIANCCICKM